MSDDQRAALDQMLRSVPRDVGGDPDAQRRAFAEMMAAIPTPDDVRADRDTLGGVDVMRIVVDGVETRGTILYLHGGAYTIGSAELSVGLASELARRSTSAAISVDYSLAPEHPFPTAVDEAVSVYRALLEDSTDGDTVVLAGESAGGGLAVSVALAIRDAGLPASAGIYVASPWADLSLSGASMAANLDVDPSLDAGGLAVRAAGYLAGHDERDGRVSPVFADLRGLPPLLVQAGGNELLLDDATRLTTRAADDGVRTVLDVVPDVPHVFVAFFDTVDEADAAVTRAAEFIKDTRR